MIIPSRRCCSGHHRHQESHIITTIFTDVFVEGTGAMAFVSGEDNWTTPKRVSVFGMILSYH